MTGGMAIPIVNKAKGHANVFNEVLLRGAPQYCCKGFIKAKMEEE